MAYTGNILTIENIEGSNREYHIIPEASISLLSELIYHLSNNQLILNFYNCQPITLNFPSASIRSTFITTLLDGLADNTGAWSVSNIGPVATTTTTSSTTTTTTIAP